MRRAVHGYFSMSSLVQFEPAIDYVTRRFLEKTEEFFASRDVRCDLAIWLQFYAFDVIGQVTWSQTLGFVDRNVDVEGITAKISRTFEYSALVSKKSYMNWPLLKAEAAIDRPDAHSRWILVQEPRPHLAFKT